MVIVIISLIRPRSDQFWQEGNLGCKYSCTSYRDEGSHTGGGVDLDTNTWLQHRNLGFGYTKIYICNTSLITRYYLMTLESVKFFPSLRTPKVRINIFYFANTEETRALNGRNAIVSRPRSMTWTPTLVPRTDLDWFSKTWYKYIKCMEIIDICFVRVRDRNNQNFIEEF